uniref:Uncharacterized protein n=1 Tax=Chromera velia CCMP2878 TaxID=1169474 RepID=A0A0G4I6K1_9ALVE|eukprot:Cvel_11440.t1-p1 / transcript=Cvel_11440.t1 / gene=Cvel_11440 / organism=Chromera_velia_CCMP2878 / gene_product=hypothetical protein / transcript_product=hypothetical protein / location=Cvel_scaffold719:57562-60809(+) / protein_length=284 / sequence_SO=supercontig / SO=protein_coding / is_pseudo=false
MIETKLKNSKNEKKQAQSFEKKLEKLKSAAVSNKQGKREYGLAILNEIAALIFEGLFNIPQGEDERPTIFNARRAWLGKALTPHFDIEKKSAGTVKVTISKQIHLMYYERCENEPTHLSLRVFVKISSTSKRMTAEELESVGSHINFLLESPEAQQPTNVNEILVEGVMVGLKRFFNGKVPKEEEHHDDLRVVCVGGTYFLDCKGHGKAVKMAKAYEEERFIMGDVVLHLEWVCRSKMRGYRKGCVAEGGLFFGAYLCGNIPATGYDGDLQLLQFHHKNPTAIR